MRKLSQYKLDIIQLLVHDELGELSTEAIHQALLRLTSRPLTLEMISDALDISRESVRQTLKRRGIEPVVTGTGHRPSLYDPQQVAEVYDGMTFPVQPPKGHYKRYYPELVKNSIKEN